MVPGHSQGDFTAMKKNTDQHRKEALTRLWSKYPPHRRIATPIQTIQTFLHDRIQRRPPSLKFIRWIEDCLSLWAEEDGAHSLGQIMGIEGVVRGNGGNPLVKERAQERNWAIFSDMAYSMAQGLGKKVAANKVAEKLVNAKLTNPNVRTLSAKEIEDQYDEWPHRKEIESYFATKAKPTSKVSLSKKPLARRVKKRVSG